MMWKSFLRIITQKAKLKSIEQCLYKIYKRNFDKVLKYTKVHKKML